jgi:hypothetical protein
MGPVFVSYKQDPWQPEVLELADELRLRGLRVFLDVIEQARYAGQDMADFLRRFIERESEAFLLYVAQAITDSPYVWNLEVPSALTRRDHDQDYLVLPFFRDRRPSEVRDSMPPHGQRLAALGGIVAVPSKGGSPQETNRFLAAKWREASRRMLEAVVSRSMGILSGQGRPLRIDIYTRVEGPADADLVLDWRSQFPGGRSASPESWQRIQSAMADLSAVLPRVGGRTIRVSGNAHLSAAVALGYTFPRPMGFSLEVEQYGTWWSSVGPDSASPLQIVSGQLDPGRKDILLVVAISRPEVVPEAMDYITRAGAALGGRIVVQPRAGPGPNALAPDDARSAVREIVGALTHARATWGMGTTHLFLAAPLALAVLLGHHLNASGRVQLYEHDKTSGGYVKAITFE